MYRSFTSLHFSLMPGLIEYGRILIPMSAFNLCYAVLIKRYEDNLASYAYVAEKGKTCPGILGPHFENHLLQRSTLAVSQRSQVLLCQ